MFKKLLMQFRFIKNPAVFYRVLTSELKMRIGIPVLRSVELAVTWRCNYNCTYCYANDLMQEGNTKDIPLEKIKEIVSQAKELGMVHLNITGGEPLLRKDIFDVISSIPEDVIISLVTNGKLLTKDKIDMVKNAGVTSIQISYGSNYIGDFKRELIQYAHKNRIPICLSIIPIKEEYEFNEDAIQIAKEENSFVLYNFPMKFSLDNEFYLKYRNLPYVREDNIFWAGKNRCPAGVEKIYVTNDGDVMICDRIHDVYGNIYKEPLAVIWKRMAEQFNTKKRPFCLLEYCRKDANHPNKVILNWGDALKKEYGYSDTRGF